MINGEFIKGDSISLEITFNSDLTGWKLRAELYDDHAHSVKLATLNSGGSNDQIQIVSTSATQSVVILKVPPSVTAPFKGCAHLEIEAETTVLIAGSPEILTLVQDDVRLRDQRIDWSAP